MARRGQKAAGITLPALRKAVAADDVAPVYLLLGEEPALRRRATECLRTLVDDGESPGAIVQIDGSRATLAEIVDEARSLPLFSLMAEGVVRIVTVPNFDKLLGSDETEEFLAYLADPVGATCVVLEADKVDKRKTLYKAVAKTAVIVDCAPPTSERDVSIWIEATLRNAGYSIEPDAVAYLLQMAGTRLTVLEQEIEKAMLYVGESGTVRAADLEGIMGRTREHSVFELTDALVKGDQESALRLLNILLDDGESPIGVLAMIGWICRQLVVAGDLVASGIPRKEAMQGIAGRWQQRGEILDRARRASRGALARTLIGCAEADLFIKRMRDARLGADRLRPARGRLEALCRQICAA